MAEAFETAAFDHSATSPRACLHELTGFAQAPRRALATELATECGPSTPSWSVVEGVITDHLDALPGGQGANFLHRLDDEFEIADLIAMIRTALLPDEDELDLSDACELTFPPTLVQIMMPVSAS